MGQIAHVTEHAAILGHGLLRGVVGTILGMRTNGSQNPAQDRLRKSLGVIATRARDRRSVVGGGIAIGAVDAEMVVAFGGAGVALGAPPETTEEAHDGRQEEGERRLRRERERHWNGMD